MAVNIIKRGNLPKIKKTCEIVKAPSGFYYYDPKRKVGTWNAEVEFEAHNLTPVQTELARKIIDENNKGCGFSVIMGILDKLARAGFHGKIEDRIQLNQPLLIVIDSKIETDN